MRAVKGHKISFWGYALPSNERIPRNSTMADKDWGWDATCSCGWDSQTGGAIMNRVDEAVAEHKMNSIGYTLIDSMRGDEHDMIEHTCRAITASFSHRGCTRCNPHHEEHTYKVDCATALATLEPCSYCDSPGAWDAAAIYRRNS